MSKHWPEVPNPFGAVSATLPVLCGALAAFSSGYFAAVIVAEAPHLATGYHIPILGSDPVRLFGAAVTKRYAISAVSLLAIVVLLWSILRTLVAQMYHYDAGIYDDTAEPPVPIQARWRNQKRRATSHALICFQFGVPLVFLSLVLLLDENALTAALALCLVWLLHAFRFAVVTWQDTRQPAS
ncbi:MAG: hypothetical protein QM803_18845 [Rhodocyclaceae bacterium]